jgi:DNA polymerase III subunit epsilon
MRRRGFFSLLTSWARAYDRHSRRKEAEQRRILAEQKRILKEELKETKQSFKKVEQSLTNLGESVALYAQSIIDRSKLPPQFIVADIETTGLNPNEHEIIEIGAIRVNRDSDANDRLSLLVQPTNILPAKITQITGITSRMLEQDGQSLESAMKQFLTFIRDSHLVYYNAPFDHRFLCNAADRFGMKIENPVSCALDMARRAWPQLKSYKLTDFASLQGPDTTGYHRALKDCELTLTVYSLAVTELGRGS